MSIDRGAYSDTSIFDAELANIFAARIYAGSVFDFAQPNDYRSLRIGSRSITVRSTHDGIRAFNNVCLHRNALIDPPGNGNRAFRCNYHGWTYGANGALENAPLTDVDLICERQLVTFPIIQVGGMCFLALRGIFDATGIGQVLQETGILLTKPFHRESLDHACNWKLLVENVLENYHVSYVHKRTFIPAGFTSTSGYTYQMKGLVSWSSMIPTSRHDRSRAMQRISKDAGHYYRHAYVFPDLFLANTNGLIGFQSNLIPVSATVTRLEWSLFELPALSMLAEPIRQHFRNDAIKFASAALQEDKELVESCQLGLQSSGGASQFQLHEGRIAHFHTMYGETMSGICHAQV